MRTLKLTLAYDGTNAPKLLEYNADTPTALVEAGVVQWFWLKDVDERGFVVVDENLRTGEPGVWAAGNATNPRAQVITAAGEGSAVAIAINTRLVHDDTAAALLALLAAGWASRRHGVRPLGSDPGPGPGPLLLGAFAAAATAGVPVVPVVVVGTDSIMEKGSLRVGRADIAVRIGHPIEISGRGAASRDQLMEEVRQAMIELGATACEDAAA